MTRVISIGGFIGFIEHAAFVFAGFVLMVVGLAMGVTMVMLPAGLVIGLLGIAMFVGGLFARIGSGSEPGSPGRE